MASSDWEISAPDDATMQQAFTAIGIRKGDGLTTNKVRFCVNYYNTKYMPTGNTVTNGIGQSVPEMVAQTGTYAIVRWVGPTAPLSIFPPSGVTLPPGVTVTNLTSSSSPYRFA